jgi:putative ABC transport system permease protein
MKFFPLLWATLWRKKVRTIFTLLSIVIAFLLFGMLQGVNAAFHSNIDSANINRLIVSSRISLTQPLPLSQMQQMDALPGVAHVTYAVWFDARYQEQKNFLFAVPTDIDRYMATIPEVKVAPDQVEALKRNRAGMLIGKVAAQKYGFKIGDRVPLHSNIWTRKADGQSDWAFDVVGFYDFTGDPSQTDGAIFNYSYFDEARGFGNGTIGWWIVSVKDPNQSAAVAKAIDKLFENSSDETKSQSEKEFAQGFMKQFGDINFIVTSILGAVFFTLLFLTGNTMMQSVRERIPEMAVLKTLGFSNGQVLTLVFAESLLLCLIAAALGLAVAQMIFPLIASKIGAAQLPLRVLVSGGIISVLLALVTGLPPALTASRLNIVDALRK